MIETHARQIEQRVSTLNSVIDSVSNFFESSVRVTPSEWATFTRGMASDGRLDLIKHCVFAERVELSALPAYERLRTEEQGSAFTVYRRPGHVTRGGFAAPIRYVAPIAGMEHAIGMDLASSREVFTALDVSAQQGSTERATRFRFDLSHTHSQHLVLFHPVFRTENHEFEEAPETQTLGWVVLSTSLDEDLKEFGAGLSEHASLELFCNRGDAEPAFVAGWYGSENDPGDDAGESAQYNASFVIGDERWTCHASVPGASFVSLASEAAPMTAVTVGFVLLTCVLVWVVTTIRDRATVIASKMTERLKRTEELLEDAGMLVSLGGWEYDIRTKRLGWSKVTRQIHEVDDDYEPELGGAIDFYEGPAQSVIQFAFEQCLANGKPYDLQLPFVTAKGNKKWVRSLGKCHYENGEPVRIQGAFLDVTRHVEIEQELMAAKKSAEDASFAKSQFLANMSHEIRTPMTAILGYADLLSDENSDKTLHGMWLTTIRHNGEHLLAIINDILDLSKIEAGRLDLESEPTSVATILDDVLRLYRDRAEKKGLRLSLSYATPVPASILSDALRVRQVLFNLISNAIKFTDTGSVSIEVRYDEPSEQLRFEVRDTGIGMNEEVKDRIFESFSQADISTTRRYGGTGLGLRISRSLVEMMDGELVVDSKPGEGSTFRVSIRAVLDPADTELVTPSPDSAPAPAGTAGQAPHETALTAQLEGVQILVAEDGLDNQRLISYFLQEAGADVRVVDNGQAAIESIADAEREGSPYTLVLMDMQMPVLDGYSATARLRQQGCELPIIALTAHAMESDRQKCLQAGCDDYLTKPVKKAELIRVCAGWAADPDEKRRAA